MKLLFAALAALPYFTGSFFGFIGAKTHSLAMLFYSIGEAAFKTSIASIALSKDEP